MIRQRRLIATITIDGYAMPMPIRRDTRAIVYAPDALLYESDERVTI